MRHLLLIFTALFFTSLTYGQIIKIQGGISSSTIDWKLDNINLVPMYENNKVSYSVFAGLDYWDKQYFNLSSNIGLVRKGGKGEMQLFNEMAMPTGTITQKASLDYISINTLIELKYPIKESILPFISIGPRFDYLINSSKHFDSLKDVDELNSTSLGMLLGGGIKYDLLKIQLGIRFDYYVNFNKVADWENVPYTQNGEVKDNTFTINLTIGYKLK